MECGAHDAAGGARGPGPDGGQRAPAAARPEDAHLPPVHEHPAGHGDDQTRDEDEHGHEQPHGGRGGRGHALARVREVEDVPGGADAPRRHWADAHAVDGVPLHAAQDAGVAARLVLAQAAAATGLVVLVGAAVVALHGAVATAPYMFLHLQRSRKRVDRS